MTTVQVRQQGEDAEALALARVALALGELAAALGVPPASVPVDDPRLTEETNAPARLLSAAMPVLGELVRLVQPGYAGERLTPREHEVLELLLLGLTDRDIAERLCISPSTAETHVKRIRAKLGGGSRAAVVARTIRGSASDPPLHRNRDGVYRRTIA